MYMHSVHQVLFCQNRLPTEAEWEHAADVGQREYNKGQKKYLVVILVLEKTK
jgi:formylglycine-generating enzyme required for sulfatase activity